MLVLQDLAREDVRQCVKDVLEGDLQFKRMQAQDTQCAALVQEISDKAQGVFLWSSLVVAELLKSVQNADGFDDLRRRLHSLPSDIEEYSQHIFVSIDPFYRKQTAQILQFCAKAHGPLLVITFLVFDHEDHDYAIKTSVATPSSEVLNQCKTRYVDDSEDVAKISWKSINLMTTHANRLLRSSYTER